MKRFLWAVALLLPVCTQRAHADSITTFFAQANISFITNFDGDNQSSIFTGAGVNLVANGDVACLWCGPGVTPNTPGSSLTPSVNNGGLDWVDVSGSLRFNGQAQACTDVDCALFATGITALKSFTFPTNGRNITVTIPAMLNGLIGGQVGSGDSFHQFDLQVPRGKLVLTFDFVPAGNGFPAYYQFTKGSFTTTPEPGTLGLMASGLAGILGALLTKRNCQRSANQDTTARVRTQI